MIATWADRSRPRGHDRACYACITSKSMLSDKREGETLLPVMNKGGAMSEVDEQESEAGITAGDGPLGLGLFNGEASDGECSSRCRQGIPGSKRCSENVALVH